MPKAIDLTHQKFGRLTVLKQAPERKSGELTWLCLCECGELATVRGYYLRSGHTTSCGCAAKERWTLEVTKHNGCGTPEYTVYRSMLQRCNDPNYKSYPRYGGRGISVCEAWQESFPQFLQDMGPRPTAKHTIERIDNDGDYEPGNCRWATRKEQAFNRSRTHRVTMHGITKSLKEWSETMGLPYKTVHQRVKRGMDYEKALTTPLRK